MPDRVLSKLVEAIEMWFKETGESKTKTCGNLWNKTVSFKVNFVSGDGLLRIV